MWSLVYSNRKCNEYERTREHVQHLQRLVNMRPVIDVKKPKKPKFLFERAKKEQMEAENKQKIQYENNLVLKKIIEIETHLSDYNPIKLKIKECPALERANNPIIKSFEKEKINKQNFVSRDNLFYILIFINRNFIKDLLVPNLLIQPEQI